MTGQFQIIMIEELVDNTIKKCFEIIETTQNFYVLDTAENYIIAHFAGNGCKYMVVRVWS